MKKLYLSFLWHMHQPYYKDDFTGRYALPWVFLHGIKDYYEMPSYLKAYPSVKAVFNFVPSLLIQMEDYATGHAKDDFLELVKMESGQMSEDQKTHLLPQLFMANVRHMIYPLKRYRELHEHYRQLDGDSAVFQLSDQDILDLKVLFLLSWTGNFIRKESKMVQRLLEQGQMFSEKQKSELLTYLLSKMGDIVDVYKALVKNGQVEMSATPFYHPILPLLIDPLSAKEAKSDIIMPRHFVSFPDDAAWHVAESLSYTSSVYGEKPKGMWPAEGSVSTKAAHLFAANGVEWIASDEDVLFQSLGKHSEQYRSELYKPHRIPCPEGKDITIFCRDKKLSDLIGFSYSNMDGEKAAADFVTKLKKIYDQNDFNPHVSVILDGENAWEFYYQNGAEFFNALYRELSACDWLEMLTLEESLDHPGVTYETLPRLKAGSWIYGNFTTWVGHEEKNRGWELLSDAWQKISESKESIRPADWQEILKELRIAQGSDWFWWYGDDHFSAQSDIFDQMFRTHVINMYKIAGLSIPPELYRPIKQSFKTGLLQPVSDYIRPDIDGHVSGFFEWLGAGAFDLTYDMGAMHSDERYIETLYWGIDQAYLYFRLDGVVVDMAHQDLELHVELVTGQKQSVRYVLTDIPEIAEIHNMDKKGVLCAMGEYIEMRFPLSIFSSGTDTVNVQFRLMRGDTVIERGPLYSYADLDVSDAFLDDWIV